MSHRPVVTAILGPTAVGKTACAIAVARRLGAEIVSCDSRQIYRHMDIGTAKPEMHERQAVPHHLIDIVDPGESYSAARYAQDARDAIYGLHRSGKRAVLCGGTGFYFHALVHGIDIQVPADPAIRSELKRQLQDHGVRYLYTRLQQVDPVRAAQLHPNDAQRIQRALEIVQHTGVPVSRLQTGWLRPTDPTASGLHVAVFVLTMDRDVLYARIDARVEAMVRRGLWEEFAALLRRGYDASCPGLKTVGYKELFDVYRAHTDMETAQQRIARHTRNYAKRQLTWFRNKCPQANTLDITRMRIEDAAAKIVT